MTEIIRNQVTLQKQMQNINSERPVAGLTLRLNADKAIVTTGSVITWDAEIRNLLFTWSGSNITIPSDGMYHICFYLRTNIVIATMDAMLNLVRGGTTYLGAFRYELAPSGNTGFVFSFTQYLVQNDILQVRLIPSANCNLLYRQQYIGSGGQSGIFHIIQLTGEF
jgi:hypothetical protein